MRRRAVPLGKNREMRSSVPTISLDQFHRVGLARAMKHPQADPAYTRILALASGLRATGRARFPLSTDRCHETLRIGRIPDLLNKARIQREFERTVVADAPQQIEQCVHGLIDWMVASELRQWQAVTEHVERRRAAHAGRVVGGETGKFQYDREKLINTVGRAAASAVDSYDREGEAAEMAEGVRAAVAGAALAQAGAVGLGALVTALATTTAADVTGIVAAGTIAVLGLFVIPSKRAHAKSQLRARIERMRTELMTGLRAQFEREVDKSVRAVIEAIAPYTRFVRAEYDKLTGLEQELKEIGGALARLRAEIERP